MSMRRPVSNDRYIDGQAAAVRTQTGALFGWRALAMIKGTSDLRTKAISTLSGKLEHTNTIHARAAPRTCIASRIRYGVARRLLCLGGSRTHLGWIGGRGSGASACAFAGAVPPDALRRRSGRTDQTARRGAACKGQRADEA